MKRSKNYLQEASPLRSEGVLLTSLPTACFSLQRTVWLSNSANAETSVLGSKEMFPYSHARLSLLCLPRC